MIHFDTISIRNLLSYGNAPTLIDLAQGNVLISGPNGAGKSSLGDAISFGLFGKPFRKINIPQLVNSINQQNCVIELTFHIGADRFKVIRGLKPNKFEIYKNDELIKQEAATKDYQLYLETQILKINHKMFIQIFVLGQAVFVPFMQLPAGIRRSVIEDLLDINVFGVMSKLLKDKITKTKEEIQLISTRLESAKKESITQKRLIDTLNVKRDDVLVELNAELQELEDEIVLVQVKKTEFTTELAQLLSSEFPLDLYEDLRVELSTQNRELVSIKKVLQNVTKLTDCPTCLQTVGVGHKEKVQLKIESDVEAKLKCVGEHQHKLDALSIIKEQHDAVQASRTSTLNKIQALDLKLDNLTASKTQVNRKILASQTQNVDIEKEKDRLRELGANALKLIERKNDLLVEKQLQDVQFGLLKDSGIKASIIKEYLPILNRMINKYLQEFDFFINFILDENFDERLLARGRDTAQYFSLSEGEKKRIDVAILLQFRHIAQLKNSAKINVLVLDELDSGLDHESRLKLLELIKSMNTNTWMVQHSIQNTELEQQFDKIAYVQKKGDFTDLEIN